MADEGIAGDTGQPSLFEALGGRQAVDVCVVEFYSRVLSDPGLAPFFDGVDMDALTHMQQEFFTVALGGPVAYAGSTLSATHAGRGIEAHHVAAFSRHLIDTMLHRGLPPEAVAEVADRITLLSQDVMGSPAESE